MPGAAKEIILNVTTGGKRLDAFLSGEIMELSRSRVQELIKDGYVLVGGSVPKRSYIVQAGDRIKVTIPPLQDMEASPEAIPLNIFYEDNYLLVVDKPRGMVVHPSPGHEGETLVNALLHHCEDLSGIGGMKRPGIVHRLDKDTSGLLVVAKNDFVHQELSRQLKEKMMSRVYMALAWGKIKRKKFKISAPLGRDPRNRKKMAVVEGGKEAVTNLRVMAYPGECTLLRAELETGRTHQIRVHLSSLGHSLVGDPLYGGKKKILQEINWQGQALHARLLGFFHPQTGAYMQFIAPFPADFKRLMHFLRGDRL